MSLENFLALLEYLYTDHAPIEEGDSVGILELSNKYVLPRLMALCELYISKEVERATAESITQADVDVVGKWYSTAWGHMEGTYCVSHMIVLAQLIAYILYTVHM